ncbi:hypothetical protein OCH239_12955 [Roseivivax halodurans JCM 10272]|uniref:Bacterial sugar transferase domain-containing protein n=2 Tax=Roseivivax halodurans TaxID=93683 RepID=X7EDG4_9RHOB|nr:hypothetical protein OCH239_12955 [Roseivivax halodurans JCM 10272]
MLDITGALVMIVLFAPLFLTIIALVWLTEGGPFFFGHQRIGRNGLPFRCMKFRTMRRESEEILAEILATDPVARKQWNSCYKLENDPRIMPGIGHFLRKTSLDELPQLFNVLWGEMSLVGPRPVTEQELAKYGPYKSHYLAVRPGLTGEWQIGGRSSTTYDARVRMDVWYVENAGVLTDVRILARTVTFFLSGRLGGAR